MTCFAWNDGLCSLIIEWPIPMSVLFEDIKIKYAS